MASFKVQLWGVFMLLNLKFSDLSFGYRKLIASYAISLRLRNGSDFLPILLIFFPVNSHSQKLLVMVFAIVEFSPYRNKVFVKRKLMRCIIDTVIWFVWPTIKILKRLS